MMKNLDFLHVDTNSLKLKNNWVDMAINGCAYSDFRTLKFMVSHQEINGTNWFFVC